MKAYGTVMAAVTEFVVTILAFLFVGRWFDGRGGVQGSSKYMTIGVIVGFGIAVTRMVIRLKGIMGDSSD